MKRLLSIALLAALPGLTQAEPLVFEQVTINLPGGAARGYYAEVDLLDPAVEIVVTSGTFCGNSCTVPLVRTNDWLIANDLDLAINANFFGNLGNGTGQLLGLSASAGTLISNPRQVSGRYDPAIGFRPDGTAYAGYINPTEAAALTAGVAGIGPGTGDTLQGTLLVDDGVNIGAQARVSPTTREPRTAVGVTQDGSKLLIAAIDGRQPGYSQGITLPQLADFLISKGAWDAVNLDGGGSTSFVARDAQGQIVANSPSDGSFRAVANHLGVRVNEVTTGPGTSYGPRPIRGVWLRPITSNTILETWLADLAEAGITDLFLETFYHGLATNDSNVFNDRFAHDELAETILAAHRHGMRVHAWLETGYWGFGSSADYILAQNPDWLVTDINGVIPCGDQPSQKFVNLAHPGVQQMLTDYVAELAAIPGLEGIHIDYHRYPVDNSTTPNSPAPYSYDLYTMNQFVAAGFGFPAVTAATPSGTDWNAYVTFRRAGISSAAEAMYDSIHSVTPGLVYSAAIFASATTSSSQLAKMQDWPAWANGGYMEVIIPMAYGSTQSSIRSDLNLAKSLAPTTPIVAGLALTGTSPHPPVATQLDAVKQAALEGFVFFEGGYLAQNAAELGSLRAWLDANAAIQLGDLDEDGLLDGRDLNLFRAIYTGTPVQTTSRYDAFDLDSDGFIDADDEAALMGLFARARYGADGIVDALDLEAFLASFTGPGPGGAVPPIINLHDLDADNDVDYDDQLIFHTLLTVDIGPDLDVDRNGVFDVDDLYEQHQRPVDVDRNGVVNNQDTQRAVIEFRTVDEDGGL